MHMINKNYFQSSYLKNYDFELKSTSVSHFVIIFGSKMVVSIFSKIRFEYEVSHFRLKIGHFYSKVGNFYILKIRFE